MPCFMRRLRLRLLLGLAAAVAALALAGGAGASEAFSDWNVELEYFGVNTRGEALVVYRTPAGKTRRVLVWGAVNALPPTDPSVRQVRFRYDYAGGWGKYRNPHYWRTFRNACRPYDGPPLAHLVTACTAADGSHWALQSWQRRQPLLGFDPWLPHHTAWELHVSHWTGDLPLLEVHTRATWAGRWEGVFGRLTYLGAPVHGFASTSRGNPKDRYSRNVYIDTFNSAYGAGWRRESGILTHRPTGTFCHSFVPQRPFDHYPSRAMRPAAPGERYRVTVMGPGVTPVVQWEGLGLRELGLERSEVDAVFEQMMAADPICLRER
jgi:hypothetical protein